MAGAAAAVLSGCKPDVSSVPACMPPETNPNAAALAAAPPQVQKQMIGEKLFPAISKYQPELAGIHPPAEIYEAVHKESVL